MKEQRIKNFISVIAVTLALLRLIFFNVASERMDETFFLLITVAILVHVVPWENITKFKGWGIELTLDKPQVKGALEGAGLKHLKNTPLWDKLSKLEAEMKKAHGSRLLWIDDNPRVVVSERRILRALGIEVVMTSSSAKAESILEEDNDFDLIISDVQRKGEVKDRETRYGGIYFIKELRARFEHDPVIKVLPVIFYSAYRTDQIKIIKEQVGEAFLKEIEFCGTFDVLLPQVIVILAEVRSNPVAAGLKKPPTRMN